MNNDEQDALNLVSGFLAGFYHEMQNYDEATRKASEHLAQFEQYKVAIANAMQKILRKPLPPGTLLNLVREEANRYVLDDEHARMFLQEIYNSLILPIETGSDKPDYVSDIDEDNTVEQSETSETFNQGDEIDVSALIAAIQDSNVQIRSQAVIALGQSGDKRAVEPLIGTLKDGNPQVRWGAIQALWRLGDMRALEPLLAMLKDEDSYVRRVAAYGLGQLRNERAIEPLIAAFQDENPGVRISASLALGQIGASAVVPLIDFLDKNEEHTNEVEHALRAMNDRQAAEPLLTLLKNGDSRVRAYAAKFLIHFGSEKVVEYLRQALTDPDTDVRHYAQMTLDILGTK